MQMEFSVTGQQLWSKKAPPLASEGEAYLTAKFTFDEHWLGKAKTAVFFNNNVKDTDESVIYYNQVLSNYDDCTVPWEVLAAKGSVGVGVFGVDGNSRITTNFVLVMLPQGSYIDGATPENPTPDLWQQIVEMIQSLPVGGSGGPVTVADPVSGLPVSVEAAIATIKGLCDALQTNISNLLIEAPDKQTAVANSLLDDSFYYVVEEEE